MATHLNPQTTAHRQYSQDPEAIRSRRRRSYLNDLHNAWLHRRRAAWIKAHGPCAVCGSDKNLEVDHKNPSTKEIPTRALWGLSPKNPRRIAELAKCQVLCRDCHKDKTSLELAAKAGRENLKRQRDNGGRWLPGWTA